MANAQTSSAAPAMLPISVVERETGLAKDTLRIWERRYGFPKPLRDRNGDRIYTVQEVERLRHIKRLVDSGFRPGKVIAGSIVDSPNPRSIDAEAKPRVDHHVAQLLVLVKRQARRELSNALLEQLGELGLRRFVLERIAPLTTLVGESWARGELSIHGEHLYAEFANGILRTAAAGLETALAPPRILLTTLPGEPHGIGLLMARCLMALESAETISLGVETPIADMVAAAEKHEAQVVALSVSQAFNAAELLKLLPVLRQRLNSTTQLWVGGQGAAKAKLRLRGIALVTSLSDIAPTIAAWRGAAPEPTHNVYKA